jgi:RNA polymerase sigma-70 factor (ECF subfamily)
MPTATVTSREDMLVVEALRQGDERAFEALVDRYHATLIRLARMYVRDRAVAEEVVQETCSASSTGSTASKRGRPSGPGSSGSSRTEPRRAASGKPVRSRFLRWPTRTSWRGRPSTPGASGDGTSSSTGTGARHLVRGRTCPRHSYSHARLANESWRRSRSWRRPSARWSLFATSRAGARTRCVNALDLSETNQRVLLHRARTKVRQTLAQYLTDE